MLPVSET